MCGTGRHRRQRREVLDPRRTFARLVEFRLPLRQHQPGAAYVMRDELGDRRADEPHGEEMRRKIVEPMVLGKSRLQMIDDQPAETTGRDDADDDGPDRRNRDAGQPHINDIDDDERVVRSAEFYVNLGTGFPSNDARGAATSVDPVTGEPADRVTPLVRGKGAEIGVRTVRLKGLQSTFTLWYLGLDSELLFVGDAGTTEAGRPSRRIGIEWTNYWRLKPWLTADADVSFSQARFTDDDPAGDYVPGALDRVISAGVTIEPSMTCTCIRRCRGRRGSRCGCRSRD